MAASLGPFACSSRSAEFFYKNLTKVIIFEVLHLNIEGGEGGLHFYLV